MPDRYFQHDPDTCAAVDDLTAQLAAQDSWNAHVATALITIGGDPATVVTEQFRPWRQP